MTVYTYGTKIANMLVEQLNRENCKAKKLNSDSAAKARVEVILSNGQRFNIKGELSRGLDNIHIVITKPADRKEIYNVVQQLDEPFANNKMIAEAANRMYDAISYIGRD